MRNALPDRAETAARAKQVTATEPLDGQECPKASPRREADQVLLPLERRQERLRTVNQLLLPFLRSSGRYRKLLRLVGRLDNPTMVVQSRDYTVNIMVYTMPMGPHLVLAVYASTQRARPLSPQQLAAKLRALRERVSKLRGRYFNQADIAYLVLAPAGFTRGARRLARQLGVTLAKQGNTALRVLARYIRRRYERLLRAIAGKRVWGMLPLLLYTLGAMARELGENVRLPNLASIIDAATKGGMLRAE